MTRRDDTGELRALREQLAKLNQQKIVRIHNSTPRMMFFNFLRGLAFGLGSVMGATILVSVMAWWLSQIEFVPIIGEWAKEIADEIQSELPQ